MCEIKKGHWYDWERQWYSNFSPTLHCPITFYFYSYMLLHYESPENAELSKSTSGEIQNVWRCQNWTYWNHNTGNSAADYLITVKFGTEFDHLTLNNRYTTKLCLYTIVHILLEEFKISLKSSWSTQPVCHIISLRVGVGVWSPKFSNPGVGIPR